jgi:anaerobic ribonucleoside-triphosphate reductase activating protein
MVIKTTQHQKLTQNLHYQKIALIKGERIVKEKTTPIKLRINCINYDGSIVDGPGIRTILFVQGCQQRCEGCHNPSTWDLDKGTLMDVKDIVTELKEKCINKKLTISGGEPLLQYPAILELVKELKIFDIVLYTGYELDQVPEEIFKYINYLKVGNYDKEKRTTITPYVGSKNQKFIKIRGK